MFLFSGNTSTNLLAARLLNSRKIRTVAVTRNLNSPLARICKDNIKINIPVQTQLSAGTLSFTASATICLSLISDVVRLKSIPSVFRNCSNMLREFDDITFTPNLYVFLGNDLLYPCAIYGKLKIAEIFGFQSAAYCTDEFFHAPLFGLNRGNTIFLLEKNEPELYLRHRKIRYLLSYLGLKPIVIKYENSTIFETILSSIFLQQLIFVSQAEKMGLKDCSFIENRKFL